MKQAQPEKYLLMGPPGSGKSSLIKLIPYFCDKATALDLERIQPPVKRPQFIEKLARATFDGPLFVAAADLKLADIPECFQIVLLLAANKKQYLKHMEMVDVVRPEQAGQNVSRFYDNFKKFEDARIVLKVDTLKKAANVKELTVLVLQKLKLWNRSFQLTHQ